MRPNSLKAKLRAGQRVVGALITINSPEVVEVTRIHTAARAAGKPAMIVALDHDDGRCLLAEGYQALLVVTGPLLVNAARSFLQVLRS